MNLKNNSIRVIVIRNCSRQDQLSYIKFLRNIGN